MEDINLSNCEVIKIYSDDMKFSQKISKVKSCMVYPKSDTKGIVSIYDSSSYELVFNYDYMEEEFGGYTFYNTKYNLIMYIAWFFLTIYYVGC